MAVTSRESSPKRRKRYCKFSVELSEEFPFLKTTKNESTVICQKCLSEFSISSGGRADISRHLSSEKHKNADQAAASPSMIATYFRRSEFGNKEKELAIAEAVFSFHSVYHNHSFRSMDCTSKIIKVLFEKKFTCGRTKSEAIVKNVLAPHVLQKIKHDLDEASFISVFTDASTHKEVKLFPVLIRYFNVSNGIQVKLLEFVSLPGETSELITELLIKVLDEHQLSNKLVAFCADNANTNFGGVNRNGTNNVFCRIRDKLQNENIIGIGCAGHIVNNTIQYAADLMSCDIEGAVNKIYSHFYIYTVRVNNLIKFCEEADVQYSRILGSCRTRWLVLLPAIERILQMFEPLKSYFLSLASCPKILRTFFNDEISEIYLTFIHNLSAIFHFTVKSIEGDKNTFMQVGQALIDLRLKLHERYMSNYIPILVRSQLNILIENGNCNEKNFKSEMQQFYLNCCKYLDRYTPQFANINCFSWMSLREKVTWDNVEKSFEYVTKKFPKIKIENNELFDETVLCKKYATAEKIENWNGNGLTIDKRWIEMFQHFKNNNVPFSNLKKIIEFGLCLPGTNASTERIFSLVNNLWTAEKTQMQIETIKAMLLIKGNHESCEKFTKTFRKMKKC